MYIESTHSKGLKKVSHLVFLLLITGTFLWGGCGGCNDDSTTAPPVDADGDVLSSKTTGIGLPQSIQTVPAESTSARIRRLNAAQEGMYND